VTQPHGTRSRAGLRTWFAALLLWAGANLAHAASLETITLQHSLAEDLVPVLQPLLPADAVVTGTGNVLIVRADAATLRQVREAVATLDRAPRQLVITVGQASGSGAFTGGVRGSGTIGGGDVSVGVGQSPPRNPGAQVAVGSLSTRDDLRSVSTVRALEGRETFVAVGESRPFTSTSVVGDVRHGTTVVQTTGFRDARSGFFATPRVSGDRVTLQISPQQQQFRGDSRTPTVATQSLTTTVSGRLGEWIELGGVAGHGTGAARGVVTWGTRSSSSQFSAWVKVDEVP
jgi:type II secretory pathway component GspD/PulD (secretin)